ncbi:MAG: hypothetical protein NTV82_14745 [Candidatus Aminicenantes bacterium]|nr:hypothetical protein [Candidatus Aminicenantes bacterium]
MTEYGRARISRILLYNDVIEEMRQDRKSHKEIEHFDLRIKHFLRKKSRYFECELIYPDDEVGRIDWSEYLAIKNKGNG